MVRRRRADVPAGAACAAIAPVPGGLLADFFAARDPSFGFTWKGTEDAVTLQVLDFHAWTFLFGLSAIVGLFSLHRPSFVNEAAGTTDPLQVRGLLIEARRFVQGISSAAGLLRMPSWLIRPRSRRMPRL